MAEGRARVSYGVTGQTAANPYAFAVWFQKFSTMIGAGVSLIRSLAVLEATTDDPVLVTATQRLMADIQANDCMSAAMRRLPEVFPLLTVTMVRSGEVGGVLDETTACLAAYLNRELELGERLALWAELARLRGGDDSATARFESALAEVQDRLDQMLFCRALGDLLSAGVPFLQALACAAPMLAGERGEAVAELAAKRDWTNGEGLASRLSRLGGFSPIVLNLVAIGEEVGRLDSLARTAAELLEAETLGTLRQAASAG